MPPVPATAPSHLQEAVTRPCRAPDLSTFTFTRPIRCSKGSIKIAKLAELAKKDHQPALALTDTDNMFGALEFSDKMAGSGIQPIVGCEIAIDFGDQDPNARNALLPVARGAAGRAGARLSQPDAAELARVPGDA